MGNRLEPQLPDMAMNRQKGKSLITSILLEHLKKHNYLINIIGNICAGKSTLMELLKEEIPKASYLKIDDYRQKLNADSPDADAKAWSYLIDDALQKRFVFVESTGASKDYWRLNTEYPGNVITVLLEVNIGTCLIRYQARENKLQISQKYDIRDSMKYIEKLHYHYFRNSEKIIKAHGSGVDVGLIIEQITNIILSNAKNK